jgi:hypothetical protein
MYTLECYREDLTYMKKIYILKYFLKNVGLRVWIGLNEITLGPTSGLF